jgi:hypothetical protein
MGVSAAPGTIPWKGAWLVRRMDLDSPIWSKVFSKRMLRELPPSTSTQLSLTSFMMGHTTKVNCPGFVIKFGWSPRLKVMGTLDRHDLPGCEFLVPLGLIRVRATKDVVDLFGSFGEVVLGILGLLLLIDCLGRLENLIYKTLESVAVSDLVLSLGVKYTPYGDEVIPPR